MTTADAEGHVLGNFHAYYSFNPVAERLRFMDANTSNAVRHALLALGDTKTSAVTATAANASADGKDTDRGDSDDDANSTATVLDIGCNEGDLTIGLYDALCQSAHTLGGVTPAAAPRAGTSEDVTMFDASSTSALNELMQKEKRRVEFAVHDAGGSSHRKRFVCDVRVDGACVGTGEGVSKKVAKAKAAEAALQTLKKASSDEAAAQQQQQQQQDVRSESAHGDTTGGAGSSSDSQAASAATDPALSAVQSEQPQPVVSTPTPTPTLTERKKLFVLGVDIDDVLIERAAAKPVALVAGDAVQFCCADVSARSFDAAVRNFLTRAKRSSSPSQRQFDLVTCFSVTMWIHLNKGDDGLWTFLDRVSSMASHLIIEPQPWKCYRNAQKRLSRMRVEIPATFREIQVRQDVVERIDAFLLDAGRFRFKAQLGKTNWSRPVLLYSRTKIPGLDYVGASSAEAGTACSS